MKVVSILFLGLLILFTSCKKEGCTDELANNITAGAKKDDGSCRYESAVVFWHTSTTKSFLGNNGVTTLFYFLDGTELGSSDVNTVFSSAPDCTDATAFTRQIAYDVEANKSLDYEVKSQTGQLLFSGTIVFSSGECISQELAY